MTRPSRRRMLDRELFVRDVAELRTVDRSTAFRWMRRIMEKYPGVVELRGREMVTTVRKIKPYLEARVDTAELTLIRELRRDLERLTQRLNGVSGSLGELRRTVDSLIARGDASQRAQPAVQVTVANKDHGAA